MQRIGLGLLLVLGATFLILSPSVMAEPSDLISKSKCDGNIICEGGESGVMAVLKTIVTVLLTVGGIISIIVIIIGGIMYSTSSGDQNKITSAKNTILYAIIGLIVSVLAFAIVNYVIGNL